jgi:hypothetical protein
MTSFRQFLITGQRFSPGHRDHGRFIDGAVTQIRFAGGVQQPTPDDLELLEEGKRCSKNIVIFTTFQLRLVTTGLNDEINADRVQWENEWYEVNAIKPFKTMFLGNFKAVCTKIENV